MATSISLNLPKDDDTKAINERQIEQEHLLQPRKKVFKPLPQSLIRSIENDRRQRRLRTSRSSIDFSTNKQITLAVDNTPDEDRNENNQKQTLLLPRTPKHSKITVNKKRVPSEIRVTLYPDDNPVTDDTIQNSQSDLLKIKSKDQLRSSDLSLTDLRSSKQNRLRTLVDQRLGRRVNTSFSSTSTIRSLGRRRSTQNISLRQLSNLSRTRRHVYHLPKNSKWHIVRHRLHDIAMMNEEYARMKVLEQDLRWINLREKIRSQVLDMREMSLLRQQEEGLLANKKSHKTRFDLKAIPVNETIHIERDGRVYSMGTRDLVLGRLLGDNDIQLDTFAQLDARRQFQVQQHLLKQQEGRTRLKKNIAFSFCLCNLSFIVLMFAAMFIFAMKTILELRAKHFP